ncbi:hypothetical protein [Lysobacter gummosus]|uniref:hypothetical protein n=1 Tax=Lysobacter gummosus TaxID=262324 RepID=UPI003625E144
MVDLLLAEKLAKKSTANLLIYKYQKFSPVVPRPQAGRRERGLTGEIFAKRRFLPVLRNHSFRRKSRK